MSSSFQEADYLSKERNGHRGRNRGKPRRHNYRGINGLGILTKIAALCFLFISLSFFLSYPIKLNFDIYFLFPLGHGSTSSTHVIESSKPPPGPKMPDGTRGFTMGRGRLPISNQTQQVF